MNNALGMLREQTPLLDQNEPVAFVRSFLNRAEDFMKTHARYGSPLYIFEQKVLLDRLEIFRAAFHEVLGEIHVYYAVKSNTYPDVAKNLLKAGCGLDVSSGKELSDALAYQCDDIIFSGPGKTDAELELALKHADRVTILVDSFAELDRLAQAAERQKVSARAGVRLTTDENGLWRKFGIPPSQLNAFIDKAIHNGHIKLSGLQFHTSWNLNPNSQVAFIVRLEKYLKELAPNLRAGLDFLDIGGGYWPERGEWLQWAATPEGGLCQSAEPVSQQSLRHYKYSSVPIEMFAREIADALKIYVFPHLDCEIYTEPGRWICNDCMHILLRVIDKKVDDLVITDGGTNIIGWERFENDYCPVINLSRPSTIERQCLIMGSLCTPHDVWGYGYFGEDIQPGDILLIPSQGAYTYSLRQEFIKPHAPVVPLISSQASKSRH